MSDFPAVRQISSTIISPWSMQSIGRELRNIAQGSATVQTYVAGAYFIPFRIAVPTTITQIMWVNGTVGTDSRDAGIYDSNGNRIVSTGGILSAGANVFQTVDITDTTLSPGLYYIAYTQNGVTNPIACAIPAVPLARAMGVLRVASAYPLPSTVTYTATTSTIIPYVGLVTQVIL